MSDPSMSPIEKTQYTHWRGISFIAVVEKAVLPNKKVFFYF